MNPLVSIIIPCYNSGKYIAETLANVLLQTYTNFECIIIDDGSTDNSKLIINQYLEKDSRFKYLHQKNEGLSSARNSGIKSSKGSFIQFLDSDDFIHPLKIEKQVDFLDQNKNVDIVLGQTVLFKNTEEINFENVVDYHNTLVKRVDGKGHDVLKHLIGDCIMPVHSPLIKKEVLEVTGFFDTCLKSCEDYDFWFRVAFNKFSFQYYSNPHTTSYYRMHANSMTSNSTKMAYYSTLVRQKHLGKIKENFTELYSNFLLNYLESYRKYIFGKSKKEFTDIENTVRIAFSYKSVKAILITFEYILIPNKIWNLLYWNGGVLNYIKKKIYYAK